MNSNELTPEMIQEVVDGYLGKLPESSQTPDRKALRSSWAAQISQDAMRLYTSLNSQYHTPLEICQIMSEITGKEVDSTFRIFPPFFIRTLARIPFLASMYLSIPAVTSRTRAALRLAIMRLLATTLSW